MPHIFQFIKEHVNFLKLIVNLLFLVVIFFLYFYNLGYSKLWHDEAEVALLAKQILATGFPSVMTKNGILPIANYPGYYLNTPPYFFGWQTWIMFYVSAFSIAIFSPTAFALRLPFSIIGLFTIVLFYFFNKEFIKDSLTTKIATFLLCFSTQYIVLVRYGRYYALVMLFSLVSIFFFRRILKKQESLREYLGFFVGMLMLFHSHYLSFYGIFLGYLLFYVAFLWKSHSQKKTFFLHLLTRKIVLVFLVLFLLTTHWILFFKSGSSAEFSFNSYLFFYNFISLHQKLNTTIPLIFVFFGFLITYFDKENTEAQITLMLILCLIFSTMLIVSLTTALNLPPSFAAELRYILAIFPLVFIYIGRFFSFFYERNKVLAFITILIVTFTNIFSLPIEKLSFDREWPQNSEKYSVRSYFLEFINGELRKGYQGPVSYILEQLHKSEGKKIFASLEGISLMFHDSTLQVNNAYTFYLKEERHVQAEDFLDYDWIILRSACAEKCISLDEKSVKEVLFDNFIKHEQPVYDYVVDNREEIPYHYFYTPTFEPHVIMYQNKKTYEHSRHISK